jgi:hypothetical protein
MHPEESIGELLQLSTMALATTGERGEPHTAPVYFTVVQGETFTTPPIGRLYFFSESDSQHARDIARQPAAAVAIYPETTGWQDIRGLQMHGMVYRVEPGPEWERAWESYRLKFPFVEALKAIVARNTLFAFQPGWLRWLDNRRGFGFKQEWSV